MKILFIVPGSGDSFYCGNCFRDNLQANALRNAGHEVVIMPLYLPIEYPSFRADTPLFFPATTFYAGRKFFKRGNMPKWISRFLGSESMLRYASSLSGATSAAGLEGITLSMIIGLDGAFNQQVEPILEWIEKHEQPDVIHLSTSLLIGVARAIKCRTFIPIICSLQDEEVWIDSMRPKFVNKAWQGIIDNLHFVDKFVTTSEFYKNAITTRIPQIKFIDVVYPGVNIQKYYSKDYPDNPVIGFFNRMNRENGLDILAHAFVKLKKEDKIKNLKLKISGGYTSHDKRCLKEVKKILLPYMDDVDFCEAYDPEGHANFYRQISIICVPITFDEGVGLYLCEAFAAGRPAVEPATGSFSEIIGDAGIVYSPNSSDALAQAIDKMFTDKTLYERCCKKAIELSKNRYNDVVMAENLIKSYERPK